VEVGIVDDGVPLDCGPRNRSTSTAAGSLIDSETLGFALMCSSLRENRTLEVR
jgi:hypothetical protein